MAGFHLDDTIAAVSTAMAPAGIGIVRISGNDAFEVADRVFRAKKEGKKLSAVKSHTIHYGWITEGEEVIDEVLVMVMKGPKTYTGENTVEIDCHGGVLAVKKVLEAVLHAGARAADPGEFTKRAFLNGRMDLTQAEAVMDVISAKSAYALKSSESQLRGTVIINAGLKISLVYLVIGLADFIYQKYRFNEDMKMTKQEVKDEFKNTEGNPEIKGRQRQRMREASRRRMMQDVPKADVVITNPTHFAVAIKYDAETSKAPVVLAKGEDYLAQKIKEAAREHHIEIVENKPLARMLYANVDIGQEIPPELYQAVAEILAMVYNMREK